MRSPEPILKPVAIKDLRPTQMTVGYREVAAKRKEWRARSTDDGGAFLGHHMVPVVIGPKARHYVIDHHHLARALEDEGVKDILVNVVADLQVLDKSAFWVYLDNRGWCHTYDAEGQRQGFEAMPTAIAELADDPYRSLAGELRLGGGYAKDNTPFSEFIWADFLRRRIKRKLVEKDFETALQEALGLAKGDEANYLPGWCGAIS